jgi:hypothetical protein
MNRYRFVPRKHYKKQAVYQDNGLRLRAAIFNCATITECWYVPTLDDDVYVAKFVGRPGWHLASYETDKVYDYFPKLKDALLYLRLVS